MIIKKLLIFLLAIMMVSLPVSAKEISIIDENQTGSITLYKLISKDGSFKDGTGYEQNIDDVGNEPLAGVTFKYLKVGEIKQVENDDKDISGLYYLLNEDFKSWINENNIAVNYTMIDDLEYVTAENVNKIMKDLNTLTANYGNEDGTTSGNELVNNYVNTYGIAMPVTDSNGRSRVDGLNLGLYLIAEVASSNAYSDGINANVAKESRPFFVSLPMTNLTMIDGATAGSLWQYDVVAYPKSEMITIRKDIIAENNDEIDGKSTNGLVQKTDKNIGDYISFLLTMDVPMLQPMSEGISNTNRKYMIKDILSEGLTIDDFSENNFEVMLGNASYNGQGNNLLEFDVDYKIDGLKDGNGFILTMSKEGLAKFDLISADSKLYVRYEARLNKLSSEDNGKIKEESNEYTLTYGTSVSADKEFLSNQDIRVYTYEINLKKSFSHVVDDISVVSFKVAYKQLDNKYKDLKFVKENDGIYHLEDNNEKGVENINPDKKGNLVIKGLDDGTYEFKETKTVPGFNLLRDPIYVTLSKDYPEDGTLKQATIQSKDNEKIELNKGLDKGIAIFEIRNNETINALHTGGEGWSIIFGILGFGILAIGSVFVLKARKSK